MSAAVSTYREILARTHTVVPGDRVGAKGMVRAIRDAILLRADLQPLQRRYLYRLLHKWERRAAGHDAHWARYGTRGGHPTNHYTGRPAPAMPVPSGPPATDAEIDQDPLVASLLKKYG